MKVRLYTPEDYPTVCAWWHRRKPGWAIPEIFLPEVGFVVEYGGKPLCAAWLYEERKGLICWLAYTVSNPDNRPGQSLKALTVLTEGAEAYCKDTHGILFVECEAASGLNRIYQNHGFVIADTTINQYFKRLR